MDSIETTLEGRVIEITKAIGNIDMDNLVQEFAESGGNAVWWSALSAEADKEERDAKATLDVVKAKIDGLIRRDYQAAEKITEARIAALIIQHSEVQEAQAVYSEAIKKAAIYQGAKYAASEKQRAMTAAAHAGLVGKEFDATRESPSPFPPFTVPPRRPPIRRTPA